MIESSGFSLGSTVWGLGCRVQGLLGGSWLDISGPVIRVTMVITPIRGLITPVYNYP